VIEGADNLFGTQLPTYTLVRGRRRTLSVEVRPHGDVIVRSPLRLSIPAIEVFLLERAEWIRERRREALAVRSELPRPSSPEEALHRGAIVNIRSMGHTYTSFPRWQRREAIRVFSDVITQVLPAIGVPGLRFRGLAVRSMRRRWGSCTNTGKITLNERLIIVPDDCIRAVIVHELCHLVHLNHSPAFRQLTRDVFPEIDEADAVLDKWSAILTESAPKTTSGAIGPAERRILPGAFDTW